MLCQDNDCNWPSSVLCYIYILNLYEFTLAHFLVMGALCFCYWICLTGGFCVSSDAVFSHVHVSLQYYWASCYLIPWGYGLHVVPFYSPGILNFSMNLFSVVLFFLREPGKKSHSCCVSTEHLRSGVSPHFVALSGCKMWSRLFVPGPGVQHPHMDRSGKDMFAYKDTSKKSPYRYVIYHK